MGPATVALRSWTRQRSESDLKVSAARHALSPGGPSYGWLFVAGRASVQRSDLKGQRRTPRSEPWRAQLGWLFVRVAAGLRARGERLLCATARFVESYLHWLGTVSELLHWRKR